MSVERGSSFRPSQQFPDIELRFPVRPRFGLEPPAPSTADALGLGPPPPPPGSDRLVRRIGLGVLGTAASILWIWSLTPPPL